MIGILRNGVAIISNRAKRAARSEATKIVESDPKLTHFPLLKERLDSSTSQKIHFE